MLVALLILIFTGLRQQSINQQSSRYQAVVIETDMATYERLKQDTDMQSVGMTCTLGHVDDAKYLRHDAGNLAAFLKMLQGHPRYAKYYTRIVRYIQRVMPQFGDFDLESVPGNKDYVRLNWKDSSGSDYLFDPHQISDGSLRFMALAALLLQPPDLLP